MSDNTKISIVFETLYEKNRGLFYKNDKNKSKVGDDMRREYLFDWISSIFLIVFSIVLFISTYSFKRLTVSEIGPAFLPRIVAILLFAMSVILLVQLILKQKSQSGESVQEEVDEEEQKTDRKGMYKVILSIMLMIIYLAVMPTIGFLISTFIYLIAQGWMIASPENRNLLRISIVSLIVSGLVYYIFRNLFHLMLPSGILG